MEEFELPSTEIGGDIYGIAYASLIDADKIKDGLIFEEDKGKTLPKIAYNQKEINSIFRGAIFVILFQITMVFLIINFMISPENNFKIVVARSFYIIIPRILSALMMHL